MQSPLREKDSSSRKKSQHLMRFLVLGMLSVSAFSQHVTTFGPSVECYRGDHCAIGEYCLCGDDLDGVVNCEEQGSQCRALPRGATRNNESFGFNGCTTGNQCGDGFFCACAFDHSADEYDCVDEQSPSECIALSSVDGVFRPHAVADGPGYYDCDAGEDCPDGQWCSCRIDGGELDCTGRDFSFCALLEVNMTRVETGPGYFRCKKAADCSPGEYCECGNSRNPDECDEGSQCLDLLTGNVAYADGPGQFPCNDGTFSSAVPGVSGGHAGCSPCPPGSYSLNDGHAYAECRKALAGHTPNDARTKQVPCQPGFFAEMAGMAHCEPCSSHTYTSSTASHYCNCTEAGYVPNAAGTDEAACPPGTFSSECASECTTCQAGRYQTNAGSAGCVCTVGGTIPYDNGTGYSYCGPGTFAAGECNEQCTPCEHGHFNTHRGEENCDAASPGFVSQACSARPPPRKSSNPIFLC